jgi:predicted nuclease of predicted toxin-antitoxin system
MKIVLDMNVSPEWLPVLQSHGHEAMHWREIGDAAADDSEIFEWASRNGAIVVTNDLGFEKLLAVSGTNGPSVILFRKGRNDPSAHRHLLLRALTVCKSELESGALVILDHNKQRLRMLPLNED